MCTPFALIHSLAENYLGFPTGVSGHELAGNAFVQAVKFGAATGQIRSPQSGRRHTNQLQDKLRRATETAKRALKKLDAHIFKESDQSMYLWAALPEWPDSMKLAKAMLERGVTLAPGAVFSPTPDQVSAYCRFNVAYLADERFVNALRAVSA